MSDVLRMAVREEFGKARRIYKQYFKKYETHSLCYLLFGLYCLGRF